MKFVYVVNENGEVYPNVFTSYNDALNEVKKQHEDWNKPINQIPTMENKATNYT